MPDKNHRIPMARRPIQGGQNFFNRHQLEARNDEAARAASNMAGAVGGSQAGGAGIAADIASPFGDFAANRLASNFDTVSERGVAPQDAFVSRRGFNEVEALKELQMENAASENGTRRLPAEGDMEGGQGNIDDVLPPSVTDDAYVQNTFGYSLLKKSSEFHAPDTPYGRLDLWAEQPRYSKATYFFYLVSRRRNAYAVIYDFDGKRVHPTYSSGNRGLKNSDKGFRADGAKENAHQVTSQYITDALPKIYEREVAAGRMKAGDTGKKVEIVVRVLGFYNGRSGSVRAVKDRQDVLDVKFFEDITPYPLNGPRMPKSEMQP